MKRVTTEDVEGTEKTIYNLNFQLTTQIIGFMILPWKHHRVTIFEPPISPIDAD
ncbi:MAG: hypothetical protein ACYSOZ_00420 [Planctomycetota bacterium]|jgi:hypothetical protein